MPPLKKRNISITETEKVSPSVEKWRRIWGTMVERLIQYRKKYGDCLVPQRFHEDPKLGRWVNKQRENKDSLSPERKKQLDDIGFVWSVVQREPWNTMFDRLVEYKKLHGDCLVPQRYKADSKLGGWVREQRKSKDHLSPYRRERLESIGFAWRLRAGTKDPEDSSRKDNMLRVGADFQAPHYQPPSPTPLKSPPSPFNDPVEVSVAQQLLLRHQMRCIQEREAFKLYVLQKMMHNNKHVGLKGPSPITIPTMHGNKILSETM